MITPHHRNQADDLVDVASAPAHRASIMICTNKDSTAQESDRELVARLVDRARAEGVELVGENGLLGRLAELVLESALEGEITDHLGYDKQQRSGDEATNSRNGAPSKTVITDLGPVEISVPRDREGRFSRRSCGRVAEPAARPRLPGDLHRCHPCEVAGSVADCVI
ncbi:transposase [Nonomuraea sp. NPDC049758]|uniref:transposase n=1 Tax=Nonomuraea sp. NPDC049758 TaxID=3154360 RepID=UPI0034154E6E